MKISLWHQFIQNVQALLQLGYFRAFSELVNVNISAIILTFANLNMFNKLSSFLGEGMFMEDWERLG